uniref:GAF domaincontaining protein putative n=1 Tax=Albugo laibachii Nc14 TaxID=890382 RepID=F0WFT5_9STRA|nr:GAF domaincontaining protein putative [Albugo laibachii Nc14]|eukprot:CCA20069.1 GAF domaincontaining protein putative [Albugo laibachii Nc14]
MHFNTQRKRENSTERALKYEQGNGLMKSIFKNPPDATEASMKALSNHVYSAVDWNEIYALADHCEWKEYNNGFRIATIATKRNPSILVKGALRCSVSELRNALRDDSAERYNDTLSLLFGKKSMYEATACKSSVQIDTTHPAMDQEASKLLGTELSKSVGTETSKSLGTETSKSLGTEMSKSVGTELSKSLGTELSKSVGTETSKSLGTEMSKSLRTEASITQKPVKMSSNCQVRVKTATVLKAGIYLCPIRWNYMTLSYNHLESNGFFQVFSTLHNAPMEHVNHLWSVKPSPVIGGFAIENEFTGKDKRRYTQLLFFAQRVEDHATSALVRQAALHRLHRMAGTVHRIQALVCRRRLGAQVFSHRLLRVHNKHCNNCIRSFSILQKKGRCQLCGYNVCIQCSSIQQVERRYDRVRKLRICNSCMERVESCNYDDVTFDNLLPPRIVPKAATTPSTAAALAQLLEDALCNEGRGRKSSVISVIKYMLHSLDDDSIRVDDRHQDRVALLPLPNDVDDDENYSSFRRTAGSEEYLLEQIESLRNSQLSDVPVKECVLGSARHRTYPLEYDHYTDAIPKSPFLPTEKERVNVISTRQLRSITDIDELMILCEMAKKEMCTSAALVTIVDDTAQHVICSTYAPAHQQSMPRHEAVCPHLIMEGKPLLLPHLQADVRFHAIGLVTGPPHFQFYCGFPLWSDNDTVVGALCCVDQKSHVVNEVQYNAMLRLASIASKILHLKSEELMGALQ